jgi:iron(III) transport system ATP-binding protein
VADFVGKASTCCRPRTAGGVRVGLHRIPVGATPPTAGRASTVYLRPEDVLARPIAPGEPHVFDAQIEKIEFLGSYCLVHVLADALGEHRLTVYLSLNFLSEQSLAGGHPPCR